MGQAKFDVQATHVKKFRYTAWIGNVESVVFIIGKEKMVRKWENEAPHNFKRHRYQRAVMVSNFRQVETVLALISELIRRFKWGLKFGHLTAKSK